MFYVTFRTIKSSVKLFFNLAQLKNSILPYSKGQLSGSLALYPLGERSFMIQVALVYPTMSSVGEWEYNGLNSQWRGHKLVFLIPLLNLHCYMGSMTEQINKKGEIINRDLVAILSTRSYTV